MRVSPNIDSSSLPAVLALDDKVRIFEDRTRGWMLDIADQVLSKIDDSGYATLSIVLSYYEMIGTCRLGYTGNGQSKTHFEKGFVEVHSLTAVQLATGVVDELYKKARCGLYHVGMTRVGIYLTGDMPAMFSYNSGTREIVVNPHLLLINVRAHFDGFVRELTALGNVQLRQNFEKWYDAF